MEQYIPKSILVAEIKRRLKNVNLNYINTGTHPLALDINKKLQEGISKNLRSFLSFINTLEVKEIDDNKSSNIKEVDFEKELIKWHKKHFKKDGTFIGMSGFYLTNNSQIDIAKYFFDLCLKVQKGEINGI